MSEIKNNKEKGIALISTLILGLVAFAFISALFYLLSSGTWVSGSEKRYTTALEAAKGVSDYLVEKVLIDDLSCGGGGCSNGDMVDISSFNVPNYNINATLLNKTDTVDYSLYSFRVEVTSNTGEKSIVEFVFRLDL